MTTTTQQNEKYADEYGIERSTQDDPGFIDKYRQRWAWFDHLMLMNERYTQIGGNQFSAGITYFSVLSMFPLLMIVFAIAATVLASHPEILNKINAQLTTEIGGELGETLHNILITAVNQRGSLYGLGGLTALWTGINWMNNLRYAISKIWNYSIDAGNFFKTKLVDLLELLLLLFLLIIAVSITAIGNSGLSRALLGWMKLDQIPGIEAVIVIVALVLGLVANFLVMYTLIKIIPHGEVPRRSAIYGGMIGAVAFEAFKQLGTLFFTNALTNPAGATFGPIIGVMVLFYFMWRIVLYCNAWAATTKESLAIAKLDTPAPAVIHVREETNYGNNTPQSFTTGLALGASVAGLVSFFLRRK
ncbi:MAG: YhjD/YihY/BrkB family envelope integrity protein [Corynebacterium sp.]|nr:YhjD/YihY/BrkB family envelope integrity protein [Corynebacterium sp.]